MIFATMFKYFLWRTVKVILHSNFFYPDLGCETNILFNWNCQLPVLLYLSVNYAVICNGDSITFVTLNCLTFNLMNFLKKAGRHFTAATQHLTPAVVNIKTLIVSRSFESNQTNKKCRTTHMPP